MGAAPPWRDDLFPFATPPAMATLLDIAWRHATREGYYDWCEMGSHFDFMFDLAAVPEPPQGWECSPEFDPAESLDSARRLPVPLYAVPEFVPFGARGDGSYVGWLVPAPELGLADHPVGLADGHEHGVVDLADDTRGGLEFLLSHTLRKWRDDPSHWAGTAARCVPLVERITRALEVHPDPERGAVPDIEATLHVPGGWRHEPASDGIGVLAPAHAFAARPPLAADVVYEDEPLEPALVDATRMLDAGYPATALLGLKETFVAAPGCAFADLKPLWQRAYRDLGRPWFARRLDTMAATYQALPCFCRTPHP